MSFTVSLTVNLIVGLTATAVTNRHSAGCTNMNGVWNPVSLIPFRSSKPRAKISSNPATLLSSTMRRLHTVFIEAARQRITTPKHYPKRDGETGKINYTQSVLNPKRHIFPSSKLQHTLSWPDSTQTVSSTHNIFPAGENRMADKRHVHPHTLPSLFSYLSGETIFTSSRRQRR